MTPEQVKKAHAAALQVIPGTPNTVKEWERLAAAEVDALITDDPAELIAWLKKTGRR